MIQEIVVPAARPDSFVNGVRQIPVEGGTRLGIIVDAVTYHQRQIEELRFQVMIQGGLLLLVLAIVIVPPRVWRRMARTKLW